MGVIHEGIIHEGVIHEALQYRKETTLRVYQKVAQQKSIPSHVSNTNIGLSTRVYGILDRSVKVQNPDLPWRKGLKGEVCVIASEALFRINTLSI